MVGAVQRPAGQVDADRGRRLGREGAVVRAPSDLGAFRGFARDLVEHDVGGEPGGRDPEPGETRRVRDIRRVPSEERAEPRTRVDRTRPAVGERDPLQLRERREEVARQLFYVSRPLLEAGRTRPPEW